MKATGGEKQKRGESWGHVWKSTYLLAGIQGVLCHIQHRALLPPVPRSCQGALAAVNSPCRCPMKHFILSPLFQNRVSKPLHFWGTRQNFKLQQPGRARCWHEQKWLRNATNRHCQCLFLNIREPGKESSTLTASVWKHLGRFNTCLQHPSGMKPHRCSKCQKCRHRIWRGNSKTLCNFEEKPSKRSLIRQKIFISDSSLPP